jgi:K+ transporter
MSKAKSLLGLISPAMSARSAVKEFKTAKDERDRLALANAVAHIAVFIVGVLLTIRELRSPEEDE